MRRRGGRKRKVGLKRHPDGSVVRTAYIRGNTVSLSSLAGMSEKAQEQFMDQRRGSASGRLECLHDEDRTRGITRFERLAGERWAMVVTSYRTLISSAPNPNAPACNLLGTTGRAPEKDPFLLSPEEKDKIETVTNEYLGAHLLLSELPHGDIVISIINDIFLLDRQMHKERYDRHVQLARTGLKALILHFGLTSS